MHFEGSALASTLQETFQRDIKRRGQIPGLHTHLCFRTFSSSFISAHAQDIIWNRSVNDSTRFRQQIVHLEKRIMNTHRFVGFFFFFELKKNIIITTCFSLFFWDRMPGEELQFDANVNSVGTVHVFRFLCEVRQPFCAKCFFRIF